MRLPSPGPGFAYMEIRKLMIVGGGGGNPTPSSGRLTRVLLSAGFLRTRTLGPGYDRPQEKQDAGAHQNRSREQEKEQRNRMVPEQRDEFYNLTRSDKESGHLQASGESGPHARNPKPAHRADTGFHLGNRSSLSIS